MSDTTAATKIKDRACCFCGLLEDNELEYGKIYEQDGLVTHYYCLLLSSNMEQRGSDSEGILGFLTSDIQKELRRGKRLVCSYCKKNGATLGCCNIKCKKIFHFPCGLRAGSLHQFFGEFRSYCISHRPKQKINEKIRKELGRTEETVCCICYETVYIQDFVNTLWAPCCKKNTWFHRKCIQQLAQSAGYFFKCPLCNNKHEFEQAMKENGIFIPSQDASWELVPNAFEELLYRHDQCDATICLCPKGRKYTSKNVKWELVLCRVCGSQGIHTACGQLKWGVRNWECNDCSSILRHTKVEEDDTSKSTSSVEDEDSDSDDSDTDISVGQYSPVPPSLNCSYEYECNSPESPPDISPVKIRPGPRSFKIKQEIYANTLMGRTLINAASSCDEDNTTSSVAETRSESSVPEKSMSSSNLSNPLESEDTHKDTADNDIIMIESDDESEIVQREEPEAKSVENEPSVHTESTDAPVGETLVEVNSCAAEQESKSNEPKSDLEEMKNSSDNTACIKATSPVTTIEDSSASNEINFNEDPFTNIKIVNVTSLSPEVFAGTLDSTKEKSIPSLNTLIDLERTASTAELSAPTFNQTDSSLKRKPEDVRVVNNITNDLTIEKCKKLRSNDFEKAGTSIPLSAATPVYNTIPLRKVAIPISSDFIPQHTNYGPVSYRNILPKPGMGNITPVIVNNVENNRLLKRHRSEIITQSQQQDQTNSTPKHFERHSFPRNTIHGAANGFVKADLPSSPQIIIQIPDDVAISNTITISQQNTQPNALILEESNSRGSNNLTVTVQNDDINSNANENIATNESITMNNIPRAGQSQLPNNRGAVEMSNAVEIPALNFLTPTNSDPPTIDNCHGDAGTSPAVETGRADAINRADATNGAAVCSCPEPPGPGSIVQTDGQQDVSYTVFTPSRRTSDCQDDASSQKQSNSCDRTGIIPEYVQLRDLKFRVCGSDQLQMILYETFSVNIDVAQPLKRKANACSPKRASSHAPGDVKHGARDATNGRTLVENGDEDAHDDPKENRVPSRGGMQITNRDTLHISGISDKNHVVNGASATRMNARITETRNTNCQNEAASAINCSSKQSNHEENVHQHRNAVSQDVDSAKLNIKSKRVRNSKTFKDTTDTPIKVSDEINSDNQGCESHVNPDESKIAARSAMKLIRCINFDDDSSSEKESVLTDRRCRVSINLDKIQNLVDAKPTLFSAKDGCYDIKFREYINSMKDDRDMKKVITLPCKHNKDLKKSQASDNFKDTIVKDKLASYVTCTKVNPPDVGKALIHENSSVTKDFHCDDEASKRFEKMFISGR